MHAFFYIKQMNQFTTISQLGVQAAQRGDLNLAETYFRDAAALQGEPPEAVFNLCKLLQMQGRNKEVVRVFQDKTTAKDYSRIHPQLLLTTSQAAISAGDRSLACELLRSLNSRYPDNIETSILLSTLQIEAGQLVEAKSLIHYALTISSGNAELLTNLAICEAELGHIRAASEIHNQIIKGNPNNFLAHYNYGKFLSNIGKYTSAEESFKVCLHLVPNAPEALKALEQIKPETSTLGQFYQKISSGSQAEAALFLRGQADSISLEELMSCICHLKKEHRSYFGDPEYFSPKSLVQQHDLSRDGRINLKSLYELVKNNETLIENRPGKPTVAGFQTHEILKDDSEQIIVQLRQTIRSLAIQYCSSQNIPTIKPGINTEAKISGWGVFLNSGGHQKLHTHPEAILSGVIYLKTSAETESKECEDGNIVFPSPSPLSIAPHEGLMILFPSYLPHATIPTKKDNERACIAFNIHWESSQ